MKILRRKNRYTFGELAVGEVFMWNEKFYMKTPKLILKSELEDYVQRNKKYIQLDNFVADFESHKGIVNTVCLPSGGAGLKFIDKDLVTPLNCTLIYDDISNEKE